MTWKGVKVNEENLFVYCFSIGATSKYVLRALWAHERWLWWLWHGAWHDGRIWLWIWRYVYGDIVFNSSWCSDLLYCSKCKIEEWNWAGQGVTHRHSKEALRQG